MSGSKILIDTNIALCLFKGDKNLGSILQDLETYVSFINELELLGYKGITLKEETWLSYFWENA